MRRWMIVAALVLCLPMVGEGQSIRYYPPGGGVLNRNWVVLQEEFAGGSTANLSVGNNGWALFQTTVAVLAGVAGHPGLIRTAGSAVNATVCVVYIPSADTTILLSDVSEFTGIARWGTGANVPKSRFGFMSGGGSDPATTGVFFERLSTDTNWFAVMRTGGAETRLDTGVAYSATTWPILSIRQISAGVFQYSIDGVAVASTAGQSNVPSQASSGFFAFVQVSSGTATNVDLDYFDATFTSTVR